MENKLLAKEVCEVLRKNNLTLATAESCTGGKIGAALTSVSGISNFYGFGFITYANEAKVKLLGVKSETLETFGAVSENTAIEMAEGALRVSGADIAVSVTGIAGPGGGSEEKPVGLVYIGFARRGREPKAYKNNFSGDRESVREQTVNKAFEIIIDNTEKEG